MTAAARTPVSASRAPLDDKGAVDDLNELAREKRLSARSAQLRQLADDLAGGTNLEKWAEIDLYSAFVRDDTVKARDRSAMRSRLDTTLDLLPAALIFLPIMVTWFGLYHATLAYRQSRGDSRLVGKSFLEQWQDGFDHRLSSWLYFDRIALWTLFGVGLLVVVSLSQSVIRRRSDQAEARERADLMRRLAGALTAADFQLSRFRINDSSRLALGSQQLAEAAGQVREVGDIARTIQQEARKSLGQVRHSLDQVKKLADALLRSEESVRAAATRVGDATTGIAARLDKVATVAGSVGEAANELSRSANADREKLRQSVEQAVTDSAREFGTVVGQSQRELGTSIGTALDDWRKEGAIYSHRHETTAEHLGLIVGSIEELMDRTARAIDRLPAVVDRFEKHSDEAAQRLDQSMTEATARLKTLIDRFLVGLPGTQAKADQITAEIAALKESMDLLRDRLDRVSGRKRWFR